MVSQILIGAFILHVLYVLQPLHARELETPANWCRHVCIMSRASVNDTASTGCFIPVNSFSKESITLGSTIEDEWQWVLKYPSSASGQLFFVDEGTVTFLTQKVCLDAGNATAYPVRPLFENVENKAEPIGLAGNFIASPTKGGNIFKSCMNDPTNWRHFSVKRSLLGEGTPMTSSGQYIGDHVGDHEGLGTNLFPFDFSYNDSDLEKTFKDALKQAAVRKANTGDHPEDTVQTGRPVLLHRLPFETGHAVLATNVTPGIHKDMLHDITKVAWNRLLEEIASLTTSGKPVPPRLLPDALRDHDLLELIVLAFVAIVTVQHTVLSVTTIRRSHVKHWDPPQQNNQNQVWTLIKTSADHIHLSNYQPPNISWELTGLFVAFVGAITAIVVGLLQFRNTNWRYNSFIVVRQGGQITYGPSNATSWSHDLDNAFAGAIFVVGHWYVAQIVEVGRPGRFPGIATLYSCLLIALCVIVYRFGTLREHKLDNFIVRFVMRLFRAVPQAVVGGLLRLTPGGKGIKFMSWFCSFRSTYLNLVDKFTQESVHDNVSSNMKFTHWFDGTLIPSPGDESTENRISVHWGVNFRQDDAVQLRGDEVKKAAAFLAADQFGRLTYCQAIALLSCDSLLTAAESLHKYGDPPKPSQLRGFAQLYDVHGILVPEQPKENGVENPKILEPEDGPELIDPRDFVLLLGCGKEVIRFGKLL